MPLPRTPQEKSDYRHTQTVLDQLLLEVGSLKLRYEAMASAPVPNHISQAMTIVESHNIGHVSHMFWHKDDLALLRQVPQMVYSQSLGHRAAGLLGHLWGVPVYVVGLAFFRGGTVCGEAGPAVRVCEPQSEMPPENTW